MAKKLESPEEKGGYSHVKRGGSGPFDGDFEEGTHGRGPTPYKKSQSHANGAGHSLEAHAATSGRGGVGSIGKGDMFKNHSADVEHPQSHEDFECLGAD